MTTLLVSMQHPAFSGHFPDAPVLPGVVLLDEMLRAVEDAGLGSGWSIAMAKFLQPVRPGETLTFEHEPLANGALRFAIRSSGRPVATGTLVPKLATTEADDGHQAG